MANIPRDLLDAAAEFEDLELAALLEDAAAELEACYRIMAGRTVSSPDRAEVERWKRLVSEALLSADCTWEERREGNDWDEWCKSARAALSEGEGGDRSDPSG